MPFDGSPEITRQEIARRMREIFGPNGEHWTTRQLHAEDKYCLMGAYLVAIGRKVEQFCQAVTIRDYADRCLDWAPALAFIGSDNAFGFEYAPEFNNNQPSYDGIAKLIDAYEQVGRVPAEVAHAV
jgi:hypothetical protein